MSSFSTASRAEEISPVCTAILSLAETASHRSVGTPQGTFRIRACTAILSVEERVLRGLKKVEYMVTLCTSGIEETQLDGETRVSCKVNGKLNMINLKRKCKLRSSVH
jgi:hypothetical protein